MEGNALEERKRERRKVESVQQSMEKRRPGYEDIRRDLIMFSPPSLLDSSFGQWSRLRISCIKDMDIDNLFASFQQHSTHISLPIMHIQVSTVL